MDIINKHKVALENMELRRFNLETMKLLRSKDISLAEAKVVAQLSATVLMSIKIEADCFTRNGMSLEQIDTKFIEHGRYS